LTGWRLNISRRQQRRVASTSNCGTVTVNPRQRSWPETLAMRICKPSPSLVGIGAVSIWAHRHATGRFDASGPTGVAFWHAERKRGDHTAHSSHRQLMRRQQTALGQRDYTWSSGMLAIVTHSAAGWQTGAAIFSKPASHRRYAWLHVEFACRRAFPPVLT